MFTFLFPVVHKFTLLYAGLQSFRAISSSAKPPLPPAQRRHAQRAQSAPRRGFLLAPADTQSDRARAEKPEDDQQWLTFWLLYSLFELVQLGDFVLHYVPFYGEASGQPPPSARPTRRLGEA